MMTPIIDNPAVREIRPEEYITAIIIVIAPAIAITVLIKILGMIFSQIAERDLKEIQTEKAQTPKFEWTEETEKECEEVNQEDCL